MPTQGAMQIVFGTKTRRGAGGEHTPPVQVPAGAQLSEAPHRSGRHRVHKLHQRPRHDLYRLLHGRGHLLTRRQRRRGDDRNSLLAIVISTTNQWTRS